MGIEALSMDRPLFFISHSTYDKTIATNIKGRLSICGIEAFVAHEDIEVTSPWKNEIIKNLSRCDALVVLVTRNSKNSCWVNQEVGIGINRGIPIVSVMVDTSPFGFLADEQGAPIKKIMTDEGQEDIDYLTLTKNIIYGIMRKDKCVGKIKKALVGSVNRCASFSQAAFLFDVLSEIPDIMKFSPEEVEEILIGSLFNNQVNESFKAQRVINRLIDNNRSTLSQDLINQLET